MTIADEVRPTTVTVLLGVSMGTRAVRTAQPRAEQFSVPAAERSGLVTDIERPLFFRNELIDSADGDLPHLAVESIGAAAESEPEISTGVAYRDPRQADALHAALAGAHLHNYRLVHEVEAVVEYLAATGEARNCRSVALFDLGSSGLTVSVVDLVQRTVIASQRSGEYSGDLLDSYVRNNQLERLGKQSTDPDIALFEKRCRIAKERLSTQDAVCLPDASGMILLSRENFELLIADLLDEAIEFARGVMVGANAPIDAVVLIGGGARMPIVQKRVGPLLELPSIVPTEPETVAARGAALSARPHSRTRTASRPVADANPAAHVKLPPAQGESGSAEVSVRPSTPTPPPRTPRLRPPPPRPPLAAPVRPVPARAEGLHAAPPVPAAEPSVVRPVPARTEALHAASPVAAAEPSVVRPVPARPWIASDATDSTVADAPADVSVTDAPADVSVTDAPAETTGAAADFEFSKFTDAAAVESASDTAVVDDLLDDDQRDGWFEEGIAALSTGVGTQPAEDPVDEPEVAETVAAETVTHSSNTHSVTDSSIEDDGKPVPFQLKNVYWLDADYDDDDGEDDRTRARRRLRTGGVLALTFAAVVAASGFMLTHQGTPQVVDTSVSRTQTEVPAVTTVEPAPVVPAPVLPPPAPLPETTVEPTTEQSEPTFEQPVIPEPVIPEPVIPEPETATSEPAPPPPVESVPPTPEQPPLFPGFPDFTFPVFPPPGPAPAAP
ncbi:putative uncharacterized protein [Rhodococcus sp. AW25M09]|uniref:Hsp70 family protein n=1 Tax=Rhodococcus sp. AW25M09 TaxID=1268303 RepID=UPI0002AC0D52|nr:Hsp70 family protein [Rhodococcus sp. AW25M09]CCQ13479.1 putative uncharacterized protein [Rhodococcus sp. AW25M09]